MVGIIGKKVGMTSMFDENGRNQACTVIEAGPCVVTQVKTDETDGYNAIQVAYDDKSEKNTSAGMKGHFKISNTHPKRKVMEFRDFDEPKQLGDELTTQLFSEGDMVRVIGTTKGKGFQGVVKRWNFAGVGMATHGQHNRMRAPGAIGMCSTPSKVFKGQKMGGRMGGGRKTVKNLEILKVYPDKNLVLVAGAVPGAKGSYLIVEK